MEYFVVAGVFLSVPLIIYSTREVPETPEPSPPVQQEKPTKPAKLIKPVKEDGGFSERQKKILSAMTPHEQDLFKQYLEDVKNPEKYTLLNFYRVVDLLVVVLVVGALVGAYMYIPKEAIKNMKLDL